ncbi:hypothetical protein SLEP1_g39391 [Rubroshorea leprosula]|uniref:Integrase catalytic domain-containing protein n=1 Tax=Rubroshorea leprosula TaxID=152421 RepID=A0AAV5L0V5_9ROSI|nr:hypothetical protein SLEP1_g39391 [Rubroshorea leprosula]
MIRTQFDTNIKIIRSNSGGEYLLKEFQEFLKVEGIQSQRSCPATPQQNGIVERKNRHILGIVRTLLSNSHAPPNFWVEAASTAVYLINRIPSEVLYNISPYYSLHKCHPDYSRLHVFGCVCFVHLPPHERTKLSNQAAMCVFVGYGIDQKGFLCYDPKIGRIRISRHVVFLENLFYFDAIAKPNNSSPSVLHDFSLDHNAPAEQVSIDQFHAANEQPQTCSFHQPEDGTPVDAQSVSDSNPASNASTNSIVSLRRYARTIHPPDRLNLFTSVSLLTTLDFVDIPHSYQEAISIPCWKEAMDSELSALLENDTCDMVPCPSNVSIIGSRWVFSVKLKADGSIERYKARLVAQGYKQEYGIDYIETFAPVAKMTTVRLLITLSAMHQWPISQMDVKNAFLHGNLKETVYMKPPLGYSHSKSMVCKLKRSLYGLKQAPRAWFERFRQVIVDAGYVQSSHDYSLFMHNSPQGVTLLLIYVDDMLITGSNKEGIAKLKELLCRSFQMKDLGPLTYFLGLEVHSSSRGYAVNQRKYVLDLIQFANLSDDKCVDTPMEVNVKLR